MNLKEAAQQLGVHYQTAYKWVRSGTLTAVRIGSRYEVSPAAIEQFLAARRTVVGADNAAVREARRSSDLHPEDVLEELEAMVDDPIITVASAAGFAARRGAEVLGDMCLVVVRDELGEIRHAAIDHPWPDRAAFGTAALALIGERLVPEHLQLREAIVRGETVRIEHVDQAAVLAVYRRELGQYLERYQIHSLVAAPIVIGERVLGVVAFTRDVGDHPYTAADEEFAARMGRRIGRLVRAADDIAAVWELRSELATTVRLYLASRAPGRPMSAREIQNLLFMPGSPADTSEYPVLVIDARGRTLGVNPALIRIAHVEPGDAETFRLEMSFEPDHIEAEHRLFQRLVSGELDFHDSQATRIRPDGTPIVVALHRVAVREDDATLACVVTVARTVDVGTAAPDIAIQETATSTSTGR